VAVEAFQEKAPSLEDIIAIVLDGDGNTPPPMMTPVLTVEQVLRRPWANRGRWEAWITTNTTPDPTHADESSSCRWHFRQVLPPFLTPIWQSLNIHNNNNDEDDDDGDDDSTTTTVFTPHVEWKEDGTSILTITSSSTTTTTTATNTQIVIISLDYEPTFLTMDDFPGDPNRGRELPPAVVTLQCGSGGGGPAAAEEPIMMSSSSSYRYSAYSNSLLILPPVPDMSMPFNVLSLTCSLYAYLVGSIITLLVKKVSERVTYKLHPDRKPQSKMQRLKEKVKAKLAAFSKRNQKNEEEEDNEQQEEEESKEEKSKEEEEGTSDNGTNDSKTDGDETTTES
jgi:hypothetical protein